MKIDYENIKAEIKKAFTGKTWAYAESLDEVRIGKWDGDDLTFYDGSLDVGLLLTLRVFDEKRELKWTNGKLRDSAIYTGDEYIKDPELTKSKYYMYGEHKDHTDDGYTKLREDRGGTVYFPAKLTFSEKKIGLKLGIRNLVRYNVVPVCPKEKDYDFGLTDDGAGALEVVDNAYTGFCYLDGKVVEI